MPIITGASRTAVVAATLLATALPAFARPHHQHRAAVPPDPSLVEQRSAAIGAPFLPQWERDGVPGNDPFNNQLRKFSDPLGAHGGR